MLEQSLVCVLNLPLFMWILTEPPVWHLDVMYYLQLLIRIILHTSEYSPASPLAYPAFCRVRMTGKSRRAKQTKPVSHPLCVTQEADLDAAAATVVILFYLQYITQDTRVQYLIQWNLCQRCCTHSWG